MDVTLSVLVPTVPGRLDKSLPLLRELLRQAEGKPVEVLWLGDNKQRSIGTKRNALLSLARGKYVSFVDDDDWVAPDYVDCILPCEADVICFQQRVSRDGRQPQTCYYSKDFEYRESETEWFGKPSHTMAWRREIAIRHKFPDVNVGEDRDWVERASVDLRTEAQIHKVLYFYNFARQESESRPWEPRRTKFHEAREKWLELNKDRIREKPVKCSIVMSTFNKPNLLARTLDSILRQKTVFKYEVIVVDDGSAGTETQQVCQSREVIYRRIEREPTYRNPGAARNLAYQLAKGDILIAQSDDVIHETEDTIERLVKGLLPGEFHIATVYNQKFTDSGIQSGKRTVYTSREDARPLFFLGSVWRKDVFAIGGNCERLTEPGFDDDLFSLALSRGLGLRCVFRDDVVGVHQHHGRPPLKGFYSRMAAVFDELVAGAERTGKWGEPWQYVEGKNYFGT